MTIVRPRSAVRRDPARHGRTRFRLWAPEQKQVSVADRGRRRRADAARSPTAGSRPKPRAAPARAIATCSDPASRCRTRPRARRPTTCTARASSSIRAAIRWRNAGLARPALARNGALRAACRPAAAALPACSAKLDAARRSRHHRDRADAGQRFSRHSATGAMTACCRSRRTAPTARPTSSRRWSMPRTSSG